MKGICLIWSGARLFLPSLPCPGGTGIRKQLGTISSWYKRSASRNLGVNRHGATLRQRVQRYRYWLYFPSPFGIWSAHARMSDGSKRHMTSILRLGSRTRALWEKFFYPSPACKRTRRPLHAMTRVWRLLATPTQVISQGERNPKKR